MTFTPEETKKLKAMLLYMVEKKHQQSEGHCGFHAIDLNPILEELEKDGNIVKRPTVNSERYFLTIKTITNDKI